MPAFLNRHEKQYAVFKASKKSHQMCTNDHSFIHFIRFSMVLVELAFIVYDSPLGQMTYLDNSTLVTSFLDLKFWEDVDGGWGANHSVLALAKQKKICPGKKLHTGSLKTFTHKEEEKQSRKIFSEPSHRKAETMKAWVPQVPSKVKEKIKADQNMAEFMPGVYEALGSKTFP